MLWFVGLGISGFKSIPNEALEILAKADIVYLEQFTSPIHKSDLTKIKNATKGEFKPAKNAGVECIVGHRIAKLSNSDGMTLKTFSDLGMA